MHETHLARGRTGRVSAKRGEVHGLRLRCTPFTGGIEATACRVVADELLAHGLSAAVWQLTFELPRGSNPRPVRA